MEREPAAWGATDSGMSVEFLGLGLDGRGHGIDGGVGGILDLAVLGLDIDAGALVVGLVVGGVATAVLSIAFEER